MGEDSGLVQSFIHLANEITAEREQQVYEVIEDSDIAFDRLAMILRHYQEEYCPHRGIQSVLLDILGEYPWAAHNSPVPIEVIREWVLLRCDQELESVPYKIIGTLQKDYLSNLWLFLENKHIFPPPREDTEDQKARSILVGLGFVEPYQPRWGFNYICYELQTARGSLLQLDMASIDSETIEVILKNIVLIFKCYKRFIKMLLSFYGQYIFGSTNRLIVFLRPDVTNPRKYLEKQSLPELIEILSQSAGELEGGSQVKPGIAEDERVWEKFSQSIVLKRDLINDLEQTCKDTVTQLKLVEQGTHAAYTIEEILSIREYLLNKFSGYLVNLYSQYRADLPTIIAMKAYKQDEDGRTRIDYVDEMGGRGFIRGNITFQPRKNFYLFHTETAFPIVLPVEERYQDFILRYDHSHPFESQLASFKSQLDDAELDILFRRFEKLRKELVKSGKQMVVIQTLPQPTSPLDYLGIAADGSRVDDAKLFAAIQAGESQTVEFKATCREPGRNNEVNRSKIAEEIAALANTKGGIVVFGIPDKDRPKDIEQARVMRQELEETLDEQGKWMSDKRGPKYIVDTVIGVTKGTGRDAGACWPAVTCAPHFIDAEKIGLETGRVLIVAVFPMDTDQLCRVNQLVYVRVGTSCRIADDPWIHEWYSSKKKLWL